MHRPELDPRLMLLLKNNVAYCAFLEKEERLIADADAYAAEAGDSLPWVPHYAGTRGAVLIWLGRPSDAIPFLHKALTNHTEDSSEALCECLLALAASAESDFSAARENLAAALRLDPGCPLARRVASELGHADASVLPAAARVALQPR